jgi:3-carboxy-cis,cis-muconate cycloisomerase
MPGLVGIMLAAMPQEHERSLGGWHAEWETLPEIVRVSAGALYHMAEMVAGLEVDPTRMQQNLELTHGLIFAEAVTAVLGKKVGKSKAHQILESASRKSITEKKHLREVLTSDPQVIPHLNREEIVSLFEPLNYTGVARQFIDRAIAASQRHRNTRD